MQHSRPAAAAASRLRGASKSCHNTALELCRLLQLSKPAPISAIDKRKCWNVLTTSNYANVTKAWDVISHDLKFYYIMNNIFFILWIFSQISVLIRRVRVFNFKNKTNYPFLVPYDINPTQHPHHVNQSSLSTSLSLPPFLYTNDRDSRSAQSAGPPLNLEQTRIILRFGQSILCLMDRSIKTYKWYRKFYWRVNSQWKGWGG